MFTLRSIKIPGSTGRWLVVFGASPNTCFPASHRKVHASRVRSSVRFAALLTFVPLACFAQQATPTPSPSEAQMESVVVSATRRYSAGSIACKRERDQFGAVGAETDPTRERCPA